MFLKSLVKTVRALRWAPYIGLALLSSCGVGTVLDPLVPTRIIAFGDAFMDVSSPRFTVNDEIPHATNTSINGYLTTNYNGAASQFSSGSVGNISNTNSYTYTFNSLFAIQGFISGSAINQFAPAVYDTTNSSYDLAINPQLTVIERIAADYGFPTPIPMSTISSHIVPSGVGAYSFAQANALVMNLLGSDTPQSYTTTNTTVNYTGASTQALSVQAQIDLFLSNNTITPTDLFIINAGTADILFNALGSGGASGVTTAANNFVGQIMRLVQAGAKHVVVFGPPNMGRSPLAYEFSLTGVLSSYSKTLSSSNCTDFNCAVELGLQQQIGTITQNPVLFVDISGQTSLITGTTTTGSANTYASFADPLYGIALAYPGDPAAAYSDGSTLGGSNYYCNQTNINSTNNGYPNPFYINSPALSTVTSYPNFSVSGQACFANPSGNNYLSYAYADAVYFTPSVHRMLGDFILGKLSLASWR
jgi:hypothetical protein